MAGSKVFVAAGAVVALLQFGVVARPAAAQQSPTPVPLGGIVPQGGTPVPLLAPTAPRQVGPGFSAQPPVQSLPAQGSVSVATVVFEGATAFPASRLAAIAGVLTGPAVSVSALEEARSAIVSLYREQGYAFVTVDAVLGTHGALRFRVAEGFINEVRLDGDIGPAGTQVLRFLNRLLNVQPLDIGMLERQLLLAQDIPGISLRTVLRPSGTAPGALSLVAQVSRQPVSGYVTADNRGPKFAGPQQALGVVQFNSFTGFGERTELALFYGRDNTQLFGQASYQTFLNSSGTQLRLYAGHGRARPSGPLSSIGYEGTTTVAGVSVSHPIIRRRSQTLNITAAFDAIENEITLDNIGGQSQRLSRDSVRVARVSADWTVFDLLLGDNRPATNVVMARLSQGVDGLGASDDNAPDASRLGARSAFTKINAEATRNQSLFAPWQDALVAIQVTIAGQWSDDVLPLVEKFYLGGARLGRGYYAGEVTGDKAIAGSVELQLSTVNEVPLFGISLRLQPTYYLFYDQGQTFQNLSTDRNQRLSSAGIGVRAQINERVEAQLEGVHRLTLQPGGSGAPELAEDAVYWRILTRF